MTSVTPVLRPEPSESYRRGEEARASRISSARSRVFDAERVDRLVGRRARLMIRRRVRVEAIRLSRCFRPRVATGRLFTCAYPVALSRRRAGGLSRAPGANL
jgi:hypothetical protein